MSTRANIVVIDENDDQLIFYQHSDGYPEGTLPLLKTLVDRLKKGELRDNTMQFAGHLVVEGYKQLRETIEKYGSIGYGWKASYIEPTTSIHFDVDYIYLIDLLMKKVSYCESKGNKKDLNKLIKKSRGSL